MRKTFVSINLVVRKSIVYLLIRRIRIYILPFMQVCLGLDRLLCESKTICIKRAIYINEAFNATSICVTFIKAILWDLISFRKYGGKTRELNIIFYYFFFFSSQDGVSIFGGAIGAMHIPEKWMPGSVDFFLNSHNIMHVLVVVAVFSMHQVCLLFIL